MKKRYLARIVARGLIVTSAVAVVPIIAYDVLTDHQSTSQLPDTELTRAITSEELPPGLNPSDVVRVDASGRYVDQREDYYFIILPEPIMLTKFTYGNLETFASLNPGYRIKLAFRIEVLSSLKALSVLKV